ncbi:LysE family translocator [Gordonia neofelifaecis]|uniref:Lysine exporter n=1 Tax=Gordonia neofelifaecis NRRL B-59395 TaxID=644548 RepID=F1YPB4_9ACTN|nr:LysE family translocator [Gordonia neofelifaecis]EGD53434.1 lysine exporter [Gordonia neofelifaecis NRRL B-59395]
MLSSLASFTFASALLVLLPGPDSLVVMRGLTRDGRAGGIRTALGVVCGLLVWIVAAVLGLSAVLQMSEIGYEVLKIVGGCYLVILGVQTLRSIRSLKSPDADGPAAPMPRSRRAGFLTGFTTDILNPKIGIMFITLLPGFVPDGYPVGWTTLAFGLVYLVLTCVYFAALILAAEKIGAWMQAPRIRRRIDLIAGLALVGFGLRLATELRTR